MKKLLIIATLCLPMVTIAQKPTPILELDTFLIQTGERAKLSVKLEYRVDEGDVNIQWPALKDTLPKSIEILSKSEIDTGLVDQNDDPYLFYQRRELQITSFDTGYLAIEPVRFIVNGDSIESNALLLRVEEPRVDPEAEFKDIKPIEEVDWTFWDWLKQNLWLPISLLIAVAAALLFVFLRKKKIQLPEKEKVIVPEPTIPAHIWALEELGRLRSEKLWQNGKEKQYHSRLSNILRSYLEKRYGIRAMEETTSQVMRDLERIGLDSREKSKLRSGLMLADLVKFAKEKPLAQENEEALINIEGFVKMTAEEQKEVLS